MKKYINASLIAVLALSLVGCKETEVEVNLKEPIEMNVNSEIQNKVNLEDLKEELPQLILGQVNAEVINNNTIKYGYSNPKESVHEYQTVHWIEKKDVDVLYYKYDVKNLGVMGETHSYVVSKQGLETDYEFISGDEELKAGMKDFVERKIKNGKGEFYESIRNRYNDLGRELSALATSENAKIVFEETEENFIVTIDETTKGGQEMLWKEEYNTIATIVFDKNNRLKLVKMDVHIRDLDVNTEEPKNVHEYTIDYSIEEGATY